MKNKLRKLSEKELTIRKFRKFLVDYNMLELWYTNVKNSKWNNTPRTLFAKNEPTRWIDSAFPWPHTEYYMWGKLSENWHYILSKPTAQVSQPITQHSLI